MAAARVAEVEGALARAEYALEEQSMRYRGDLEESATAVAAAEDALAEAKEVSRVLVEERRSLVKELEHLRESGVAAAAEHGATSAADAVAAESVELIALRAQLVIADAALDAVKSSLANSKSAAGRAAGEAMLIAGTREQALRAELNTAAADLAAARDGCADAEAALATAEGTHGALVLELREARDEAAEVAAAAANRPERELDAAAMEALRREVRAFVESRL